MTTLRRRLDRLEMLQAARPCLDPWHPAPVVIINSDEPEPPGCPTCGERPALIIAIRPDEPAEMLQ